MKFRAPRNFSLVMISNATLLVLGMCVIFLLPKISSTVEDYGYWQLYFFYTGYFGLFALGICDGLNLLHAGKYSHQLDNKDLTVHLGALLTLTSVGAIAISALSSIATPDPSRQFVFVSIAIGIFLLNISGYCLQIHQITLQFREYSRLLSFERVLFVITLIPLLFIGKQHYQVFIVISLATRAVASLYGLYTIRRHITPRFLLPRYVFENRRSIIKSALTGLPVTLNIILMTLVISAPRIAVEHTQNIREYGLFSFAFATLSIIAWIFPALSAYLYPTLRRLSSENIPIFAKTMKMLINYSGGMALLLCFGFPSLIKFAFPQYQDVDSYIFMLFPWLIYQAILGVVNDVFYRLQRMERRLLILNSVATTCIYILVFLAMTMTGSIRSMLLTGLLFIMFWANYCYAQFMRKNSMRTSLVDYLDVVYVLMFVIVSIVSANLIGVFIYAIFYVLIIFITRRSVVRMLLLVKQARDNSLQESPELN